MNRKRIDWIDIAKGLTILTVIIGHTCWGVPRAVIFSFHMPLFFILSAATFKYSRDMASFKANLKKSFLHLIPPALVVYFALILNGILLNPSIASSVEFWREKLYTIIFASGVNANFDSIHIPALGAPWFLIALFVGRSIFDFLQMSLSRRSTMIVCTGLSLIGVIFGVTHWLPFSLDIVLAILPFFYFGYYLKDKIKNSPKITVTADKRTVFKKYAKSFLCLVVAYLIWSFTFYLTTTDNFTGSYLELAVRRYPLFPICYICAISATVAIAVISNFLSKLKGFVEPLKVLGKNSMCLYILHCVDTVWVELWAGPDEIYNRIAIDIIFFIILMLLVKLAGKCLKQYDCNALSISFKMQTRR